MGNKGNNKITELRTIFQWESQNSQVYKQTKSVNNRKTSASIKISIDISTSFTVTLLFPISLLPICKLRTIFQWESQNSQVYKQTKSVNNRKTENRNDPDLVQAFLKKWRVESDFKAPNLPLLLRFNNLCQKNAVYKGIQHQQFVPGLADGLDRIIKG
jgi:hypothetical protein